MATNQDVQSIEEALNKTDLGHVINENKKPIIVVAIIGILCIIAYSFVNYKNNQDSLAELDDIHQIETNVFAPLQEGKIESTEFMKKLAAIDEKYAAHPNLIPPFMAALNTLGVKAQDDMILDIAKVWARDLDKSSSLGIFFNIRVAALAEDMGKKEDAIKLLNEALNKSYPVLKDKILFDLVRINLQLGKTEEAQKHFATLEKDHKDSEYTELANLFIKEL